MTTVPTKMQCRVCLRSYSLAYLKKHQRERHSSRALYGIDESENGNFPADLHHRRGAPRIEQSSSSPLMKISDYMHTHSELKFAWEN